MPKIQLIYMRKNFEIISKDNSMTFQILLNKFSSILNKNINSLYFLYNGKILSINNKEKIWEINKKMITILNLI